MDQILLGQLKKKRSKAMICFYVLNDVIILSYSMAEHIILSPTIQRLQSKDLNEKNLLAEKSPIKSRQDKKLNLLILGLFHSKKD